MVVLGLRQPELGQDVPDVFFDRSFGEPELGGDAGIRATFGHQRQHLSLARGEVFERIVAATSLDQRLDETRVNNGSARRDPSQRVDELVHVQDATLEQVADPIAGREELARLLDLDMCRQDEDARVGMLFANRLCRDEPLGRMRGRHPNIDDHELGLVFADELEELAGVAGLADHLET